MAALESTGSPTAHGRTTTQFTIHEEIDSRPNTLRQPNITPKRVCTTSDGPEPLSTSKLGNLQAQPMADAGEKGSGSGNKKLKIDHRASTPQGDLQSGSMDSLLAKLSEQQTLLAKQKAAAVVARSSGENDENRFKENSTPSSTLLTPASESGHYSQATGNDGENAVRLEAAEMARLKRELDAAKDQIARQKHEIDQSRVIKHTIDQAMGPSSDGALSPPINHLRATYNVPRQAFGPGEDVRIDSTDFNTASGIWSNNNAPNFATGLQPDHSWGQPAGRPWGQRGMANGLPPMMMSPQQPIQQRNYSVPLSPASGGNGRGVNDFNRFNLGKGYSQANRNSSVFQQRSTGGLDMYSGPSSPLGGLGLGGMNPASAYDSIGMYPSAYQPRPIGSQPLSPTADEFRAAGQAPSNPWNAAPPGSPGQTYVSPMEPLNYRRLLDRSVTCNWKYIVDKIVCNNDQQASIFLQQKLKVGTVEQKYEIIEAIVAQAYPLMVNRFGNFLVQRCFEVFEFSPNDVTAAKLLKHGTPEQVIAIANAIRGNTLSLSMDAFGCHVVQKAFDAVPEDYKAIMVHELLRRIPETVIHRYACHVWQKLFELRWSDSPPQIMKYVNEALGGMWHEVALGETGSLVVQNIFENCLEEDKRPCINEVLNSIDIVAHGQFGNWCIQHICEHGLPSDRSHAIDHVLRYATEYSMDQFASKVVEKCLKIGGPDFLERYLERVCEGRADRPRIPLIDIASDQYGNYLIQYILTHASPNHRDIVASHIRKHMVSLRGSKFGSRVGMLCCNPAYATHPGPGIGMPATNRFSSAQTNMPRFSGGFR